MTHDQLEALEAIVELGSFQAAAKKLHKTQPALSAAVKKLETEFQISLFDRSTYRPTLTEQGKNFYFQAKETLLSFRKLHRFGNELGSKAMEPKVTIMLDPLAPMKIVRSAFEQVLHPSSTTDLILMTEVMGGGTDQILQGEAQFAVAHLFQDNANLETQFIKKVELYPVVLSSLCKNQTIDTDWLKNLPQIVVVQRETGGRILRREQAGLFSGGQRCYVTDHEMKRKLILEGLGWGRLADFEIQEVHPRLKKISHPKIPKFELSFHIMRAANLPLGPCGKRIWNQSLKASQKKN